jgi:hypothetical protein
MSVEFAAPQAKALARSPAKHVFDGGRLGFGAELGRKVRATTRR